MHQQAESKIQQLNPVQINESCIMHSWHEEHFIFILYIWMATKAHIGLCKYGRIYETGCETKKGLTLKVINPFLLHAQSIHLFPWKSCYVHENPKKLSKNIIGPPNHNILKINLMLKSYFNQKVHWYWFLSVQGNYIVTHKY